MNHGVEKEVKENVKAEAAEFFELPLDEKNNYAIVSEYIKGYGNAYIVSEEQLLDSSDALMPVVHPSHYWKSSSGRKHL